MASASAVNWVAPDTTAALSRPSPMVGRQTLSPTKRCPAIPPELAATVTGTRRLGLAMSAAFPCRGSATTSAATPRNKLAVILFLMDAPLVMVLLL